MGNRLLKITPIKIVALLTIICGIAIVAKYFAGPDHSGAHTHFNNYIIFIKAFWHLIHNTNLYILYPTEQWDLYKYSPSFALGMGLFAWLPIWIGYPLFSLFNAWSIFMALFSIETFKKGENKLLLKKIWVENYALCFLLLFISFELIISIQNVQTNAWIAALIIGAFNCMERKKIWLATLLLMISVFIKILGIVGFAMFLLYPKKFKFIYCSLVWFIIIGLLPLIVISPTDLIQQYQNWWVMLKQDHDASYGLSVMGWLHRWFGWEVSKSTVLIIGAILFCTPFYRINKYINYRFRYIFLCSILIWIVIFNHRAESPSFIIAMSGIGLWYFSKKRSIKSVWWIILVFLITSLCTSDLVPEIFRNEIYGRFHLKAMPSIVVWAVIWWELMRGKFEDCIAKNGE